jgi:hypothetical protein
LHSFLTFLIWALDFLASIARTLSKLSVFTVYILQAVVCEISCIDDRFTCCGFCGCELPGHYARDN